MTGGLAAEQSVKIDLLSSLVFGRVNGKYWTHGIAHDLFGHAAHQYVRKAGSPMSRHHNQITAFLFSLGDNHRRWSPDLYLLADFN
jgi:hypothetical protein